MHTSDFKKWRSQLNLMALNDLGVPLDELPPFDLEAEFAAGKTPEQCFLTTVRTESILLGYADAFESLPWAPSAATELHDTYSTVSGLTGASLPLREHLELLHL